MATSEVMDGVQLFRCILRFRGIDRRLSMKAGLRIDEMHCLGMIFLERPSCIKVLGEFLDQNATRMSKILSRLEQRGLVVRSLDLVDHRKELITLTEAGYQTAEKIITCYHDVARHTDEIGMPSIGHSAAPMSQP